MKESRSDSGGNRQQGNSRRHSFMVALIILSALTIAMFSDVLFTSKDTALSAGSLDLRSYFIHWRGFGFNELRQGNLALWNPHIFSGSPFFAGFQSALLYPFNCVYLLLPLSKAINCDIALHIFLVGIFMYLWTSHRRLHPLACLVSSVLLMFCGALFLHISAGHLTVLCASAWAPLIFLSIDGLFEKRPFGWCLLGMFAITMQILAGHPQYVFYTAVAAVVYSGFRIIKAKRRAVVALGLIGMYFGATALGAVQLLPGIQFTGESIRTCGMSYESASHFSFPPENLITFLAPGFLGNITSIHYWGKWYLWEGSLFVGVTGFVLLIYGAIYEDRRVRYFSVPMVTILLLLALGAYTPLFRILHTWVPGFNKFRASSRFIFQTSLFITMLAGTGLNHLIRHGHARRRTAVVILVASLALGVASLYIRHSALTSTPCLWEQIMQTIYETNESLLSSRAYTDADFIRKAGIFASKSLMISAGTLALLSALFFLTRFYSRAVYAIALLSIIEIFVFARASQHTFDIALARPPGLRTFLAKHPGDYRILQPWKPNTAMSLGAYDILGYDPLQLGRYAQFIAFTKGCTDVDNIAKYPGFSRYHHLYAMLRCRYIFVRVGDRIRVTEFDDVMPRLQLIQDYALIPNRNQIFRTMEDTAFDPRQRVILETPPDPEPVKSEQKGTAKILDSSTDHLTIEAHLPNPAILLITDAYSEGWRARALPGSIQKQYDVMPANYILRAIPLSKGYHHIRVEYLPLAFQVGKWISIVSVIIYVGLLGWYRKRAKRLSPKAHQNNR